MGLFAGRSSSANVKRLIHQLNHNDQTTRIKAAGDLVKLGPDGVLPLLEAIAGQNLDVSHQRRGTVKNDRVGCRNQFGEYLIHTDR